MVDYTNKIQNNWRDGDTLDLHTEMTNVTLGVVAKTLFNTEVGTEESAKLEKH